jgi:hypothetical protein
MRKVVTGVAFAALLAGASYLTTEPPAETPYQACMRRCVPRILHQTAYPDLTEARCALPRLCGALEGHP